MDQRIQHVVVVEDDGGLRQAMHRLIEAAGLHAESFPSGEALLASGAIVKADCFIVDVHLPGISGFELERTLKNRQIHAKVIFITAYDDIAAQRQARSVGAAYLAKPFAGQVLLSAVQSTLESRSTGEST